ncbi:MAG TPA: tripartite tricarboxylate transporter substrate-binding protein [Nocardioidaceae bacterium]|nr:tripartite tricarboxylate transporter substrate-binding protein [Nocardioidaceae bacterium]
MRPKLQGLGGAPARVAVAACVALLVAGCGSSNASSGDSGSGDSNYPSQPVTLTAPADPGSGWDTTARALVEAMDKEDLADSPIPVQNRTGATGCVWLGQMVNAHKGDDYNIAVTSTPILSTYLRGECDHNYHEVSMIATIMVENYLLVVPSDSKYQSADDLLAAIKQDPQSVPVAASGDDQLPFALLVKAAGGDPSKINFIEYEGGGDEITALLNGDVSAAVAGVSEFRGQIESGDLKGLAVMRDKPLDPPLDNIPTAPSLGYDVTLGNWRGIYGPPGMSQDAISYWQDKLKQTLATPTWDELAKRNQWQELYLIGDDMNSYLAKANEDIKEGLKDTGAIS